MFQYAGSHAREIRLSSPSLATHSYPIVLVQFDPLTKRHASLESSCSRDRFTLPDFDTPTVGTLTDRTGNTPHHGPHQVLGNSISCIELRATKLGVKLTNISTKPIEFGAGHSSANPLCAVDIEDGLYRPGDLPGWNRGALQTLACALPSLVHQSA